MESSFKNQFLVALANLEGDYFHGSVSLIIDHNEDGAFGLTFNRPLALCIAELFPDMQGLNPDMENYPVLEGGPVEQDRAFFIHEGPTFDGSFEIVPDLFLTTSQDLLEAIVAGNGPSRMLTLLGYAGWGPGQLESELADNVWLLTPFKQELLFDTPFADRAQQAALTLGIDLHLINRSAGHG